jgi:phage-related protein
MALKLATISVLACFIIGHAGAVYLAPASELAGIQPLTSSSSAQQLGTDVREAVTQPIANAASTAEGAVTGAYDTATSAVTSTYDRTIGTAIETTTNAVGTAVTSVNEFLGGVFGRKLLAGASYAPGTLILHTNIWTILYQAPYNAM